MLNNIKASRSPSVSVLTAFVVIVGVAVMWLQSASSSPAMPNQNELIPGADYDPLVFLAGVNDSFAYVEGVVTSLEGAKMLIDDDGHTQFDSEQGLPQVVVRVKTVVDTDRQGDHFLEEFESLIATVSQGSDVSMVHSNGFFEVGREYGFLVGSVGSKAYGVVYAHDLAADRPAAGFAAAQSGEVYDRLVADAKGAKGDMTDKASTPGASLLVQLATDINRLEAGIQPSDVYEATLGFEPESAEPPVYDANSGLYPVHPDDVAPGEELASLEVIILDVAPGTEIDIQGKDRRLGTFVANELNYAILSGFVEPSDSLEIFDRKNRGSLGALELRKVNADASNEIYVVLSAKDPSQFRVTSDLKTFNIWIEELKPVLDGSVSE